MSPAGRATLPAEGALKVVDRFVVEIPSRPPYRLTRQFAQMLEKLGASGKTVVVDFEPDQAVVLAARNIPGVKLVDASALNVYDVLDCKTLVVDARPATNLVLSGRNIPGVKVVDASEVNVYDVLDCRTVLVSAEAVTKLEERLIP